MFMAGKVIDIIRQVLSKQRAYDVINSCETADHFDGAEKYIENYYKLTSDYLGYQDLLSHFNETRINSLFPQY